MFFWNFLAFSTIQWMLTIWSLVPLPFYWCLWILKTALWGKYSNGSHFIDEEAEIWGRAVICPKSPGEGKSWIETSEPGLFLFALYSSAFSLLPFIKPLLQMSASFGPCFLDSLCPKKNQPWDFPGCPGANTAHSQCKGPWVWSLGGKLDPTCCN